MGFGGLYISVSGINANKKALDTVSHNVANVNNPNYVRQSVIHRDTSYSMEDIRFQKGTGVDIHQVRQTRNQFLDFKLRREMATFGYYNTKSTILNQVESIFQIESMFDEATSSGFQDVMVGFWDSWAELLKEPDSLTVREIVHENGVAFVTTVNHISTQLDDLQFNLNKEILNKVDEVNMLLGEISNFNKHIKLAEGYGSHITANDYRDERNAALDRLSELIPITHYENQYGEEIVSLFGRDLVYGDICKNIEVKFNKRGQGEICWPDTEEIIDLKGLGELGGYIDARDSVVTEYVQRLDILVGEIAEAVNEIHMTGKSLDWKEGDPPEEIPFFIITDTRNPAATIKVNPELVDFRKIAVSQSGDKGDGEKAKEILNLREELLYGRYSEYSFDDVEYIYLGDEPHLNIDGFYRELVLSIGLERQQARTMVENQSILITQILNRRQEVSSVSLDEEMTDMLKYQHSYIANSRVINAIDEMIENIVNRMGIVGR